MTRLLLHQAARSQVWPRRTLHALALVVMAGSVACQSAVPAAPAAPAATAAPVATTVPAAAPTVAPAAPAAPATSATPAVAAPTTPPVAASPTQPPQPTPTARPAAPTATPSTLERLPAAQKAVVAEGQRAIAAGDYTQAVQVLTPAVAQVQGDALQAEVRLLLGQAQVGAGAFTQAQATAQQVLDAAARAPQLQPAARLLKGQALRGQKQWDAAATEMRAAAEADPMVGPAIRLQLAEMWLGAGRPDQAAADARTGLNAAEARLLKIDLAEKLGTAEVAQRNTDAAIDAYRQLLTAAGTKGYLGEQLYNLALGSSQLGRTDEAIQALRTSISQFPRSRKGPDAVLLLEKLGGMRAEDRFWAGLIRYYFWDFRKARADFDAYLAALPNGERAIEARYYRALSSLPKDTSAQLLALASENPDDDFAPLALLEAGKAQEELEDYATAERIYDRLVATYATRDAGEAGAFRRGLARLMRGNRAGALAAWGELLKGDLEPSVKAQALYWSGKVLAQQGDAAGARTKLEAAAAVRPVDYYVVRAQAELKAPPSSAQLDPASMAISPADEAALAKWFGEQKIDFERAAKEAAAQPGYQRAVAMVRYGLYREANWEYEAFLTQYADKPAQLYWLAARFGELGLPNAQLKLGTAALNAASAEGEISVLDVPKALQRVAFPVAFPEMVVRASKQNGVDPLLFAGLMRQESDFDPYAESVMKAKGLTQIMPDTTGPEIAGKLGVKDYTPESLFQPKRNTEFGAFYFGERLKRNDRVPQKALAAYNAGDGNVDNWTGAGREDPDVFAEYVAFFETNDYVRKIYTYWTLNRYIWGS